MYKLTVLNMSTSNSKIAGNITRVITKKSFELMAAILNIYFFNTVTVL